MRYGYAMITLTALAAANCSWCSSGAFIVPNSGRLGELSRRQRLRWPGVRMVMQDGVTGSGTGGFPSLPEEYPPKRKKDYTLEEGQVAVRFINSSGGKDVVVPAEIGENVVAVAKRGGVKIATACSSGLCGTCTTDIEDRAGTSYRPGFNLIRACVTKVFLVPDAEEMVLDVYRNKSEKGKLNRKLAGITEDVGDNIVASTLPEAMKRFGEGWEDGFTPAFRKGQAPKAPTTLQMKKLRESSENRYKNRHNIEPAIDERDERRMATAGRAPNGMDHDASSAASLERLDARAHQMSLKLTSKLYKRMKVLQYLDKAHRPIAELDDLLSLSEEERMERSRFMGRDLEKWQEVYPDVDSSELCREQEETHIVDRPIGCSVIRDAAYRSARQIPRYRYFGDPTLAENDAKELAKRPKGSQPISPEEAADISKVEAIKKAEQQYKYDFVYRDVRTGWEVGPHLAGTDGVVRAEPRRVPLPQCSSCEGEGTLTCVFCGGMGYILKDGDASICPHCMGEKVTTCTGCDGMGIERGSY